MDAVKFNISEADHYNPYYEFPEIKIIRLKGYKRKYALVKGIDKSSPYEHTLKCVLVYIPAPKSTLRNKSIFTKFKMKIHKP